MSSAVASHANITVRVSLPRKVFSRSSIITGRTCLLCPHHLNNPIGARHTCTPPQAPFSLRVPQRTCVVHLGDDDIPSIPEAWLAAPVVPFPPNYRAICWLNTHLAFLAVSYATGGLGTPSFRAVLADGVSYEARSPTGMMGVMCSWE